MALTRPIDEWPLLICGPILRRVTASEVAVFAATRAPCDVQVIIAETGAAAPGWASDVVRTRTLGTSLHVVVCRSNDRVVGVVVASILDIVEEELSVRSALDTGGHLGSAVVAGHVTELVDIERAVCTIEPALLVANPY